ncbi:hypothetical protein HQ531_03875 [bacterium]|nr:hypothetical protein [bacterium]
MRERGDDIILLTYHFAQKFADELGKTAPKFTKRALKALKQYEWPGNIRELENIIQRIIVMSDKEEIDVQDLPSLMRFTSKSVERLDRTIEELEADYIRRVLESLKGNKSRTAEILGIDRKTLREKIKRYNIRS